MANQKGGEDEILPQTGKFKISKTSKAKEIIPKKIHKSDAHNKSDRLTNIDKFKVATHSTLNNI